MKLTEQQLDFSQLDDAAISAALKQNQLALTTKEALKIQGLLGRAPTLAECVLWSIQGSEHCSYKSTRIHLKKLPTDGPNVLLGPKEDAGVVTIAVDNNKSRWGLVISHESHNHPSQIVPFEGAATGVGGNVRDVCCMGAKVIALADSLRFSDVKYSKTKWLHNGVVDGIASYGNALGVPNMAGDVYYDGAYQGNCLVTVVTLGILKEDELIHSYAPENAAGYDLILVGKPTDNSGFGGASFASLELDENETEQNLGAVQEPNAFLGRHLLKSNYALFAKLKAKNLIDKVGFKDLGAGGIACASVEIADGAGYGADVNLDHVHTSIDNLNSAVILCAETQERYMWAVPSDISPMILAHYNEEFALPKVSKGACACLVGKIRDDGQYTVSFKNELLINAKAKDITEGLVYDRPCKAPEKSLSEPSLPEHDLKQTLLNILTHENIASQKMIYEKYDKQVQGRTVLEREQSCAGVLQPFNSDEFPAEIQNTGIALSVASNPRYGKINAKQAAINAVVQTASNVTASGATPQAITDCLCFGNPEKPEQMFDLVTAIDGINEACHGLSLRSHDDTPLPVIGGNVSLYNETKNNAIPASPVISCLGKLNDVKNATQLSLQKTDSSLYMLGTRNDECGGSVYYQLFNELGKNIPTPDLKDLHTQMMTLLDSIEVDLLLSANVINTGGIASSLCKMSFHNEIGFDVTIPGKHNLGKTLFSESFGFIVEVAKENTVAFEKLAAHIAIHIGQTNNTKNLSFNDELRYHLNETKLAWQQGLRKALN